MKKKFNPRIKARIRKNKQIFKRKRKNFFEWVSGAELVNLKKCDTPDMNTETLGVPGFIFFFYFCTF